MTVLNSGISWCTGTLNLSVGCTQIPVEGGSACDFCYAKVTVERGILRENGRDFSKVNLYPRRLADLRKFAPQRDAEGHFDPKLVFVNSMSDFWHRDIPDRFIHDAFDAFEQHPGVIVQLLTKRPVRMRQVVAERYKAGLPQQIWLGVSAESNMVAGRINILRRLKDQIGDFCAFVSVEPIFAPTNELNFAGIDWVLSGGESGPGARRMAFRDLESVHDNVFEQRIALHFKQYGRADNNPAVKAIMAARGVGITAALRIAIEEGLEKAPDEKGGATYKGRVIQERPPAYHRLRAELNKGALL